MEPKEIVQFNEKVIKWNLLYNTLQYNCYKLKYYLYNRQLNILIIFCINAHTFWRVVYVIILQNNYKF